MSDTGNLGGLIGTYVGISLIDKIINNRKKKKSKKKKENWMID